jgi:hypothetical protein
MIIITFVECNEISILYHVLIFLYNEFPHQEFC